MEKISCCKGVLDDVHGFSQSSKCSICCTQISREVIDIVADAFVDCDLSFLLLRGGRGSFLYCLKKGSLGVGEIAVVFSNEIIA